MTLSYSHMSLSHSICFWEGTENLVYQNVSSLILSFAFLFWCLYFLFAVINVGNNGFLTF